MNANEYREKFVIKLETPGGLTFKVRRISLLHLMKALQDLDAGANIEKLTQEQFLTVALRLLEQVCVEPKVQKVASDDALSFDELQPEDFKTLFDFIVAEINGGQFESFRPEK